VLHMLREMRVVLLSLFGALVPMFWTMLCMFGILFIFVTIFVQGAVGFVSTAPPGDPFVENAIRPQFGSFMTTYRTLLMAITGGDDWSKYYETAEKISPGYAVLFIIYIVLMTFGALNIMTAIFVEGALCKAREDFELLKNEERSKMESLRKRLTKIFREFDPGMTGQITREQWETMATSDEMQEYFRMLQIDASRVEEVFRLLDVECSGVLELDDFIGGCLHIQASASYVDVDMLMNATKTLMTRCASNFDAIKARINQEHIKSHTMLNKILEHVIMLDLRLDGMEQPHLGQIGECSTYNRKSL